MTNKISSKETILRAEKRFSGQNDHFFQLNIKRGHVIHHFKAYNLLVILMPISTEKNHLTGH